MACLLLYDMKKVLFILLFLIPLIANGQIITTIAGTGSSIFSGSSVPATSAGIPNPIGGVFDKSGNYYFADGLNSYRIRKISITGIISNLAGNGVSGYSDGLTATSAKLSFPTAVIIDTFGNLFISDGGNNRIRKVDASTGIISTVAGNGMGTFSGDGLPATDASIYNPQDICLDKLGNMYIADFWNNRVRKVSATGIISTIAGGGIGLGENGPATSAQLVSPSCVAVDDSGNIYVGEESSSSLSNRVRKINSAGVITTIAGNGSFTYAGDGIPATAASISPIKITFDTSGQLYIADDVNRRVYKIDHSGIIHLVAGNGATGFTGEGGVATAASIHYPSGVAFDPCGNLYIPDVNNRRIRKVVFNPTCDLETLNTVVENIAKNISIYPNPTNNELQIDNAQPGSEYKLYDVVGAIKQQGILPQSNNTIPLNTLPPGIYLLQIADTKGARTIHKIIKE